MKDLPNMDAFREALRDNREQRKMSARSVGDSVGISVQHISDIENGHRDPSEQLALKLCNLYNIASDFYYACAGKLPPDIRVKAPTFLMTTFDEMREAIKEKDW